MKPAPMSAAAAAAVLKVSASATRQEVDRAFRARARLCHPDRLAGSSPAEQAAASAEFIRVCDARDVLHTRLRLAPPEPAGSASEAGAGSWASWASGAGSGFGASSASGTSSASGASRPGPPTAPGAASTPPRTPPRRETGTPNPGRPAPSPAPEPPTLSFADFVRARDAASWVYTGQTTPGAASGPGAWSAPRAPSARATARGARASARAAQPGSWQRRPPRRRRTSTGFRVTLVLLGVLSVGGYLALQLVTYVIPEPATSINLLKEAAVVPVTDEATLSQNCQSESGCWIWTVMVRETCAAATIDVGVADTADGTLRHSSTRSTAVVAGAPFLVVENATADSPAFADIESITC